VPIRAGARKARIHIQTELLPMAGAVSQEKKRRSAARWPTFPGVLGNVGTKSGLHPYCPPLPVGGGTVVGVSFAAGLLVE